MNVQLGRGGKVHYAGEPDGYQPSPVCGGNRASERYRTVGGAVDCAKCLKWIAAHPIAPVEEVPEVIVSGPVEVEAEEVPEYTLRARARVASQLAIMAELKPASMYNPQTPEQAAEAWAAHFEHADTCTKCYGARRCDEAMRLFNAIKTADGLKLTTSEMRNPKKETVTMTETPAEKTPEEIAFAADVELMLSQGHAHDEAYDYAVMQRARRQAAQTLTLPPVPEVRRSRLKMVEATVINVLPTVAGGVVFEGEDDVRGPVAVELSNTDARWLLACLLTMQRQGALGEYDE